jgi:hypothetical protein
LVLVPLKPLEEAVHDTEMEMGVWVEAGAEAMEKAHSAHGRGSWGGGAGLSEGSPQGPEEDVEDGRGGSVAVVEEGSKTLGYGEHHLAHRHVGNDVVHQVSGSLGHALGVTGWAGPSALSGGAIFTLRLPGATEEVEGTGNGLGAESEEGEGR